MTCARGCREDALSTAFAPKVAWDQPGTDMWPKFVFDFPPCFQNFFAAVLVFTIHLNLGNILKFKLDVESEGHWLITFMR